MGLCQSKMEKGNKNKVKRKLTCFSNIQLKKMTSDTKQKHKKQ